MLAFAAPEIEAVTIFAAMEGLVYRSHHEIREWVRAVELDWEVFEVLPEEFYEVGDRVLVLGTWRAKGRGGGLEISSQPGAWLADLRGGLVYRWRTYTERADALEALGVEEHELARYRVTPE